MGDLTIFLKKLWKSLIYIIKELLHAIKSHNLFKINSIFKMQIRYQIKTNKNSQLINLLFLRNLIQRIYIKLVLLNQEFKMKIIGHKSTTSLKFPSQIPRKMIRSLSQEINHLIHFIMKDNIWKMWRKQSLFWIIISFRASSIYHTLSSTKKVWMILILKKHFVLKVHKEMNCLRIRCYCIKTCRQILIKIWIRVSTK